MTKGLRWGRTWIALAVLAALVLPVCTGCSQKETKMETSIFAMDTVMNLTFYGDDSEASLKGVQEELVEEIYSLEDKLSTTKEESELYALNEQGQASLSPETAELLTKALELCETTQGALDITAYPAVRAWGFTTGAYQIPEMETLQKLLPLVDYTKIQYDSATGQVTIPEGMTIDLGSIAKGYAGQLAAQYLRDQGVTSALLNLGGNVQTIGSKPDGTPWSIGIQDPMGSSPMMALSVSDQAVITSGGYERYFEQDGQTYWHIMNPATGRPARSGLLSVSVIGEQGSVCDALSTALFVMGLEKAARFWAASDDFEAIFVTDTGEIYLTEGLKNQYVLLNDYADTQITILER